MSASNHPWPTWDFWASDDAPTLNIHHDMNVSRSAVFFEGSTIVTSDARIEGLLGKAADHIQARFIHAQDPLNAWAAMYGHGPAKRDHTLDWRARWWAAMQLERN